MYNSEVLDKIKELERKINKSVVTKCDSLPESYVGKIVIYDGAAYFWNGTTYEQLLSLEDDYVTQQELIDALAEIGIGTNINVVDTYNDLPDPDISSGEFYWVTNSVGTQWLPGSLGGTYYKKGLYYSTGLTWETAPVPYQATQSEVNNQIVQDKFVTPSTLASSTQWDTKVTVVPGKQLSTEDYTTVEKSKLAGIQSGAEVNVNANWDSVSGDNQILNKPATFPPSSHTHTTSEITDFGESVEDLIGTKITAGTSISVTYNDTTGETEIASTYVAPSPTGNIVLEFYESGEDLTIGIKDTPISIPYTATITGWEIAAYDADDNLIIGDSVVDILSNSFASLPLTSLDSIAGTELPTLITQDKNNDYTITTFTPIPTGNYLQGEIVSVSAGIVKIIVVLYTIKS